MCCSKEANVDHPPSKVTATVGKGESQWAKILWSNESNISADTRIVRRRVGERFHLDCVVSTVMHGGGSIQVWGCMCKDGVGSLFIVKGCLNASGYIY